MITNIKFREIRAIILDRDGVINKKPDGDESSKYVLHPDNLDIYDDFYDFCGWAAANELPIYVATNQQCLGLGLMSKEQLDGIHEKIQSSLKSRQLPLIENFYVCGHLDGTCSCRKPSPELIHRIQEDSKLEGIELIFFGDSSSDFEAAKAAGISFIQVRRGQIQFTDSYIHDFTDLIKMGVTK